MLMIRRSEFDFMKKIFLVFSFFIIALSAWSKPLLADLDFTTGRWEMVGVSLHNYHPLPIQSELGTFICTDPYIMKQIQQKWDCEEVYEDYCDYHYALKFYRNGELMRTLRVNLLCNYVTLGGLSYYFDTERLVEYRRYFRSVKWSRIRFREMDLLTESVQRLDKMPGVYWYGDVQQYNFEGYFTAQLDSLPWNADRDSVLNEVTLQLADEMGREDFYLGVRYWTFDEEVNWMTLVVDVFCPKTFYGAYERPNVTTPWIAHLSEQAFIQIVVIGLNKEDYYRVMKDYFQESDLPE